jgi:hypothetical protein
LPSGEVIRIRDSVAPGILAAGLLPGEIEGVGRAVSEGVYRGCDLTRKVIDRSGSVTERRGDSYPRYANKLLSEAPIECRSPIRLTIPLTSGSSRPQF